MKKKTNKMVSKIQISVLVVVLVGLCISSIESQSLNLVANYVYCTEPPTGSLASDETFKRRLAAYDTLEKVMLFYQKIYTEFNSTDGTALRKCMENIYLDGYLFLKQDFFDSFSKVVKDVKTPYQLLPINEMNYAVSFFQNLQLSRPFFVDFIIKYEHSFLMFYYYKETTPCARLIFDNNLKITVNSSLATSLRYQPDCPFINFNTASPQQIEDYLKCTLEEMSTVCVNPALKYFATIFAANYPQIIKGDLYSYASSLTNKFPDNNSARSSFASVYLTVFLVTFFSYFNIF